MTAKEYLEQVRQIRQEIIRLGEQIETIRTDVGSYHPIQLDDTGASHLNYRTDKLSEKMAAVVDLCSELEDKKADLILQEAFIRKLVSMLSDPREREVLTLRYLTIHPRKPFAPIGWKQIGFRMGYSAEGARHLHDRALKSFSQIIKKTES
jgi:DNA-directed RNA polymerase specialized sigma subunit